MAFSKLRSGLFSSALLLGLSLGSLTGCPPQEDDKKPTGPQPDTVCPKELTAKCKVLRDESDNSKLSTEYHALVPADTKHDEAQKYLEALYRHLMTRRDSTPNNLAGHIYTNEAQFNTPPLSPVASVTMKPGDKAPTFENKIPLELWQQVEETLKLKDRADRKLNLKRKLTYLAEPEKGQVTLTLPFTEGDKDDWAKDLSFSQVMGFFTEYAMQLFNNIPDLKNLVYIAQWQDKNVASIECNRADFGALHLRDIEERIGQLGGRAFLELTEGKTSDASAEKRMNSRKAAEYRKITNFLKQKAIVSPALK